MEFMSFAYVGEPFSKVALLTSLLNRKVFIEWICEVFMKSVYTSLYKFSTSNIYGGVVSDIYDSMGVKEMSQTCIMKLHFIVLAPPTKS
ncbi:unnamed protein product [Lathyrus sativus]|nr:unnamed protein product [Lathyrus sativus]